MTEFRAELVSTGILLAIVLALAASRGVLGGQERRQLAARRFAVRAGLPVEDVERDLARRVLRRNRFVLTGVGLGVLASTVWRPGWSWPAALYIGLALGAVAARLSEPGPAPDSPRVAHATETGVTDYVPPWILAVLSAIAALAVGMAALVLLTPMRPDGLYVLMDRFPVVLVAALPVVALGISTALARVVVRRRAAAAPADLAVDDALRSQAVRDCLHLSAAVSLAALFTMSVALKGLSADIGRRLGGWTPMAALVALAAVAVVFELTGGPIWWRSRLHSREEHAA